MPRARLGATLCRSQILRLLAHRKPFLFLDYAKDNVAGESVIGVMRIAGGARGAVLPNRSTVLEGLGQASALVIRQVQLWIRTLDRPLHCLFGRACPRRSLSVVQFSSLFISQRKISNK
jgi:hypothetical protein